MLASMRPYFEIKTESMLYNPTYGGYTFLQFHLSKLTRPGGEIFLSKIWFLFSVLNKKREKKIFLKIFVLKSLKGTKNAS